MTTISMMIHGCFAWLGRFFSRLTIMLRVTALWVILLPVCVSFLGAASNQAVLIANHDKFPVMVNGTKLAVFGGSTPDGMMDDTHCVMTKYTRLNLLADVFDFRDSIKSVGDLLIEFGGWLWGFAPFVWGFEVSRRLFR